MVRKVVSEIVSYVNGDLLERNAAKFIPGLSRKELFKKPRHWHKIFPSADPVYQGDEEPTTWNLRHAIDLAQRWLLQKQHPQEGYWSADLRADTTLESDMIMLYVLLGWQDRPAVREKIRRLAVYIVHAQNADGGWPIYRHGPSDISATFKGYWALKLAGYPADDERLTRAGTSLRSGWHPQDQHLQQVLSGSLRSLRLGRRAGDSARTHVLPEVVLLQHL